MKRTLPWAIVAFYPLIVVAALNLLSAGGDAYLARHILPSSLGALLIGYWWLFLVVTDICATAFFVVSVLRNRALTVWRRILWAVGMVFFGVIVLPAYWWWHGVPVRPD